MTTKEKIALCLGILGVNEEAEGISSVQMEKPHLAQLVPFAKGLSYFIRTVTYHLVGRVTAIHEGGFIVLEDASWVADSGRFMQAIKEGKLDEVEPVGCAIVNIAAITDAFPWLHKLPTEQK